MTSDKQIERYLPWQDALARYGVTDYANDLFWQLCRLIEVDPFLDSERFAAVLESLHRAAFPLASTRPARLTGGDLVDPRE